MALPEILTPDQPRGRQAVSPVDGTFLRSYLLLRLLIGALGIALPTVLLVGDWLLLSEPFPVRDSLSAYYHSGMRDVFVGVLVAIGVFLVTYKVFERDLDNTLSTIAGLAVVVVALFPTTLPDDHDPSVLTPLQDRLGESLTGWIHYGAAALFIGSLAVISFFFGVREGQRPPAPRQRLLPGSWRAIHWAMAGVIAAAIVFMAACRLSGAFGDWYLLAGEIIAVVAFGASWLAKGAERDLLRQTKRQVENRQRRLDSERRRARAAKTPV
jgi:hypothetical protein